MTLRRATYTDREGRNWIVELPDDAPDAYAEMGIRIGPPALDRLRLPLETEVRLHNELFARGVIEAKDLRRRSGELAPALMAALRVDVQRIVECFLLTEDGPGT